MKKYQMSLLVAVALIVAACGEAPLTTEQKESLKELNSSVSQVTTAAQTAKSRRRFAISRSTDMSSLTDKIADSDCNFTSTGNGNSKIGGVSVASMDLKVDGPNCPLKMNMGFSGSQNSVDFVMFFEITDAEMRNMVDVTRVDLSGSFSGDEGGVDGNISGSIESKKFGTVNLNADMTVSQSSAQITVAYEFPDFTAEIKVEANEDGSTVTLNGEELSQEEMNDFASAFQSRSIRGFQQNAVNNIVNLLFSTISK